MSVRAMTWARLCALATKLPGVTVEPWWGTPGFKIHGKGFARLKEDRASVMFQVDNLDTKEALLATRPAIYFTTDHYNGHPAVLARLATLTPGEAVERLAHARDLIPAPAARKRATGSPARVTARRAPAGRAPRTRRSRG